MAAEPEDTLILTLESGLVCEREAGVLDEPDCPVAPREASNYAPALASLLREAP